MFVLFVMRSYLIEVRGLKPYIRLYIQAKKVVSYRGTWVETKLSPTDGKSHVSYLIEVRGLKPDETANKLIEEGSYLIEVRGLKHHIAPENQPE